MKNHKNICNRNELHGYVQLTNEVQTTNTVSHVAAFHLVGCPVQTEDDDQQVTMVVESAMSNHFIDEDYFSERSGFLYGGYFLAPRDEFFE